MTDGDLHLIKYNFLFIYDFKGSGKTEEEYEEDCKARSNDIWKFLSEIIEANNFKSFDDYRAEWGQKDIHEGSSGFHGDGDASGGYQAIDADDPTVITYFFNMTQDDINVLWKEIRAKSNRIDFVDDIKWERG